MSTLIASGHVVDIILALVAVEFLLLAAYRRRTGRGIALYDIAFNLMSGASLMLALRCALTGAAWPWIAAWLLAALLAHLADLRRRWPR